ncbi:MAG: hypothetical protein M1829_005276 [Trizodia sp. TS-e1964]|nr:MAG: hypothetical protein M1829_005276 [Trizodia sp. TS-e1964]
MSVTVKHLNADSTFLLVFRPATPHTPSPPASPVPCKEAPEPALGLADTLSPPQTAGNGSKEHPDDESREPASSPLPSHSPASAPENPSNTGAGDRPGSFSILIDPWLNGTSTIWHKKFSTSKHTTSSCITSLRELPAPDLVLISQDKPDHCHQDSLCSLPPNGTKTIILAECAAARKINSWNHFHPDKIQQMFKWEEPSISKGKFSRTTVRRIAIPPIIPGGKEGEVTIAYLPMAFDMTGLHTAIGITYRPPSSCSLLEEGILEPIVPSFAADAIEMPPSPPGTPSSFQSSTSYAVPADRAVSILYSPHGVPFSVIKPYAEKHLVRESALPLTLLLHSFDRVQNPWWLGGNVCAGLPGGAPIAQNLLARYWISAHDEVKEVGGLAVRNIQFDRYSRDEVAALINTDGNSATQTEVVELCSGDEICLTSI